MSALWAGCGLIHKVDRKRPTPVTVPEAFSAEGEAPDLKDDAWWKRFKDPRLDALVDRMFQNNLSLIAAYARLDSAHAAERGASSGWWPQVSASIDYARSRSVFNAGALGGAGPGGGGRVSFDQNTFSMSLAASYELDIWGRVHSLTNAAELELSAAEDDVQSISMTLSALVTETWFTILGVRNAKDVLENQLESNKTYLELVEFRFGQGLASALDVLQQRQQVAAAEAELPLLVAQLAVLEHQMAELLGRSPKDAQISLEGELPALPPLPKLGVPADLLKRRPDVRAAFKRVLAADYRIGAAIADRFPTLRLSASTGFRSFDISDLFKSWIYNLAAGLVGPIFDGGRRAAEVDRNRAVLEGLIANYGQTVLLALREVENALVQESQQRIHINKLERELEVSKSTLDEARSRYTNGLSEYLPVLTALQAFQRVERKHLAARQLLLIYRIQLCRALGGSWAERIDRPKKLTSKTERS